MVNLHGLRCRCRGWGESAHHGGVDFHQDLRVGRAGEDGGAVALGKACKIEQAGPQRVGKAIAGIGNHPGKQGPEAAVVVQGRGEVREPRASACGGGGDAVGDAREGFVLDGAWCAGGG